MVAQSNHTAPPRGGRCAYSPRVVWLRAKSRAVRPPRRPPSRRWPGRRRRRRTPPPRRPPRAAPPHAWCTDPPVWMEVSSTRRRASPRRTGPSMRRCSPWAFASLRTTKASTSSRGRQRHALIAAATGSARGSARRPRRSRGDRSRSRPAVELTWPMSGPASWWWEGGAAHVHVPVGLRPEASVTRPCKTARSRTRAARRGAVGVVGHGDSCRGWLGRRARAGGGAHEPPGWARRRAALAVLNEGTGCTGRPRAAPRRVPP
jgi:hypothetical protein